MAEKDYMNECMVRDLVVMLMERMHLSQRDALDAVCGSDTSARLQDAGTGLYYQSPEYVYDFLQRELRTGKLQLNA